MSSRHAEYIGNAGKLAPKQKLTDRSSSYNELHTATTKAGKKARSEAAKRQINARLRTVQREFKGSLKDPAMHLSR